MDKELIKIAEELDNIYAKLNAEMFDIRQFEKMKDEYKVICFFQKSYYKMLNLVRSLNLLFEQGYIDEAYILVRTIYEHNLNLYYICASETKEEQINKLNKWEENFKEWDEALKKKEKMKTKHWSGLTTYELNEEAFKTLNENLRNKILNIWREACLVSHPNVITYEYKNNKGICYIATPKMVLIACLYLFIAYLQRLKPSLEEDFDKNTVYIKQDYIDKIQKLYDKLNKEKA